SFTEDTLHKSHNRFVSFTDEHGHLKIYLPKKLLECLPKCSSLPKERHRWNTNEEIAAYLITFEKHEEWLTTSPKTRPQNGSMILYNRKKVKYRKDGYCWKKRKDGKTTREDHMKLKVQGVECLYGCYVHSSIIPTFHRRCYWLLQNPDIVLVHYLNVPAIEDCGKPCGPILCSINTDKKEWAKWTKEELIGQLKPMFHGIKWTCSNGNSSTGFSAEQLVQQILDSHQTKPPPRTHNCLCTGNLGKGTGPQLISLPRFHYELISHQIPPIPNDLSFCPHSFYYSIFLLYDSSSSLVLAVTADSHKFAFAGAVGVGLADAGSTDGLAMLSTASVSEELVLSSNLESGSIKMPETNMNFDPDCFLNNPKQGQTYGGNGLKTEDSNGSSCSNGGLRCSPPLNDNSYVFNTSLVKNIKTEDMSFEQQLAKESGYQVGEVVSGAVMQAHSKCNQPISGLIAPLQVLTVYIKGNCVHLYIILVFISQGGVKVLITGPWQEASSEYTCLFDQITVPASLIQPGVLRCYCPAHDTGLVTLQVAASSQIISNSVVFEYKARALPALPSSQHDWLSLDFRMSILERLEQMERRMAEMAGQGQSQGQGPAGNSFESRVVVVCEKMMNRACWAKSKHLIHSKTFRGMTLLHLAAAQGYTTLIQTLIKWRTKHADSIDLELEVDPLNVDHFSCTPLMWACALGHMEAAVVLYKWDRRALAIPDSLGRLPLAIARSRGHTKLAECLESLQREEQHFLCTFADLRRPRSEPSSFYSSVSHGDAPLSKKHKPNPETLQTRTSKPCSGPLGLEEQAHKPKTCPSKPREVIEATSDRIKRENFVASETTLDGVGVSSTMSMSWLASYLGDPELDGPLGKLGLQTPTEWTALLNASHNKEERDLTQLALSDPEQRELYEAARQVQNTFRKYKGRPLREQQELAAAVIQRCYKRYKQLTWIALKYALYKKMTLAAILIQSRFRSYHEQKKFQQSRRAAMLIQQYYRSYKELGRPNPRSRATAAALVQQKLSLLTKRQDQAARKIMRFLLRCRHRTIDPTNQQIQMMH
uniref:Calmodulin-binding transcription activator 1 n=1 Tax=Sinocyclocheilus rhinocerous TaxID=307959 RepID=A0A673J0U3_9TELE